MYVDDAFGQGTHPNLREKLLGLGEECFFAAPFPPLISRSTPPFNVCLRMMSLDRSWDTKLMTVYVPFDSSDSMADADTPMLIMELALPDGTPGVAADVGASTGNTAWQLLANGHTVHMYDTPDGLANKPIVTMTIAQNDGWADRAHLYPEATGSGPGSLDATLERHPTVHLLKIDVDDADSEATVFRGAEKVRPRHGFATTLHPCRLHPAVFSELAS
jgi:hypothetical protein